MKTVFLPENLRPDGGYDLVRIGQENDGGYLVDPRSVDSSKLLLAFGINDDWSFERDFVARNNVPIEAFDGSVGSKEFLRRLRKKILRFHRPTKLRQALQVFRDYGKFFTDDRRHHAKMVGFDTDSSLSLPSVFAEHVDETVDSIFLKIDIEGWEYRILDDLVARQDMIEGMVLEFHDYDIHLEKIDAFVAALDLHICHCHANNYGGVDDHDTPLVIELSFTKYPRSDSSLPSLPHKLDMANNPKQPDYKIEFHSGKTARSA